MNPALFRTIFLALTLLCCTGAAAQRIAYINPAGQLVTVAPDGTALRTLTPPSRSYQFPAWSPAGNELAVIGVGSAGGVFSVKDRAGATPKMLYNDPAAGPIYLYWAPDGKKVGFLASSAGSLELQVADLSGGAVQRVTSGNPLYWQWSRNSQNLFVHTGVLGDGELAFYTSTGRTSKPLGTPGLFNAPGLSPSEKYLAYAELDHGATRIILGGNTKANAQLRREVPYEGLVALSWSPAADQLAIMNPPAAVGLPYGPIRLLDAATGDLTSLVKTTAVAFFWSPDGAYIAYIAPPRQGSEQVASKPQTLRAVSFSPQFSPPPRKTVQEPPLLELRVVNVKTGRDRLLSAFTPTPLFISQFLPFFDQYALSHRVWSPDSSALVLPMLSRGGPKVVVVPLSGDPKVLADGEMPFWSR